MWVAQDQGRIYFGWMDVALSLRTRGQYFYELVWIFNLQKKKEMSDAVMMFMKPWIYLWRNPVWIGQMNADACTSSQTSAEDLSGHAHSLSTSRIHPDSKT